MHTTLQRITTGETHASYTPLIRANGFLFVSGQVALGPTGQALADTIDEQSHIVFDKLDEVLATAGAGLNQVVAVTAFLNNPADFGAFDRVFAERFAGHLPTRCTTVSACPADGVLVEITAIAVDGRD